MGTILDYNEIKRRIESEICLNHNTRAKFTKTHDGFKIDSCCEDFSSKLRDKARILVAEHTKIALQEMLKKGFKK
jgi:hypothetical protein